MICRREMSLTDHARVSINLQLFLIVFFFSRFSRRYVILFLSRFVQEIERPIRNGTIRQRSNLLLRLLIIHSTFRYIYLELWVTLLYFILVNLSDFRSGRWERQKRISYDRFRPLSRILVSIPITITSF